MSSDARLAILGAGNIEHQGFSSAMIKGITMSATKAASLYDGGND